MTAKLNLPGWDQPLTYYDAREEPLGIDSGFEHGSGDHRHSQDRQTRTTHPDGYSIQDNAKRWSQLRRTQLEISMMHIMNAITDKPHWEVKIQDPKIREKWTKEIEQQLAAADTRYAEESRDLRNGPFYWGASHDKKCAKFIIEELKYRSERFDGTMGLLGLEGADIIKSDTAVPEESRQKLSHLVGRLEEETSEHPDWHPGRENIVRDLVHPSMYPIQYGKTKIWDEHELPLLKAHMYAGYGKVMEDVEELEIPSYSSDFQWLPAQVYGNRDFAAFETYISNLDVVHEELYAALGELVKWSLPLWNKCLATNQREDAPRRVPCQDENELWQVDEKESAPGPYMQDPSHVRWHEQIMRRPVTQRFRSQEEKRQHLDQLHGPKWFSYEWDQVNPVLIWPDPVDFALWRAQLDEELAQHPIPKVDVASHLSNSGLQVIVKIASIHLSPENPEFSGGAMHVEGMANEHICATSIFYFDSENVQDAQVAFSGGAHMGPCHYGQDDYTCLEHVYGTSLYEKPAVQKFASAKTPQGRLLAFPNVFQHQVLPFELVDKTRPGHRKMVVLWLVNPQKRIISTAHVPPQQPHAFNQMLRDVEAEQGAQAAEKLRSTMTPVMTEAEAREARLALMAERGLKEERRPGSRRGPDSQRVYFFCEH